MFVDSFVISIAVFCYFFFDCGYPEVAIYCFVTKKIYLNACGVNNTDTLKTTATEAQPASSAQKIT